LARKCDIKKDETIELIKEEYRQGHCQFKDFYSKMCIHLSSMLYMYDEFEFESSNDSADDYSISEVENEEEFTENELLVPVPYINVRTEQPVSTTQTELDFTEEQI
jgi:hypothetical protein